MKIFSERTTEGNSDSLVWKSRAELVGNLIVSGTFDGCAVKLQMSPDNGDTWVDVTDGSSAASLTSAGIVNFQLNPCLVRLNLSDAGASTSIDAWIAN